MKPNDPINPIPGISSDARSIVFSPGLTKREWFAGLAMQGMCADCERGGPHEAYARDAVKFADALIAELAKGDK